MKRSVWLVGRGKMAAAFAAAFRAAGVAYRAVPSRAKRLPARDEGRALWLLAVTDHAVEATASRLVSAKRIRRGDAVVHFAGMLDAGALSAARKAGASTGALHPLVAVSDAKKPPSLGGASASFEGDGVCLRAVREIARAIGLRVFAMRESNRERYHAAAALVATGSIALAQGAAELFASAGRGIREREVRAFVHSLLASAAHNVSVSGPARALASPLMRGDTVTIERHLRAMAQSPEARALYVAALAQVIVTLERARGADPVILRRAAKLLEAEWSAG